MIRKISILNEKDVYDGELDNNEVIFNMSWSMIDTWEGIREVPSFPLGRHSATLIFFFHLRKVSFHCPFQ